jgi:hypothetical protein
MNPREHWWIDDTNIGASGNLMVRALLHGKHHPGSESCEPFMLCQFPFQRP